MMNHPGGPHMPPGVPNHQGRRPHDYHYPPPQHLPYGPYGPPQYHGPPPTHHYPPPQWYPSPYQHYPPPMPRPYHQHAPLVVSSYPHPPPPPPMTMPRQNFQPSHPQSARTPLPEQPTPTPSATTSDMLASPSTTPTTASMTISTPPIPKTATPPAQVPVPAPPPASTTGSISASQRIPFYPQLPWFSAPASSFPPPRPRRKRRVVQLTSNEVELPSRHNTEHVDHVEHAEESLVAATTTTDSLAPSAVKPAEGPDDPNNVAEELKDRSTVTAPIENSIPLDAASDQAGGSAAKAPTSAPASHSNVVSATVPSASTHKRKATIPVVPIVPITPLVSSNSVTSPRPKEDGKAKSTDEQLISAQLNPEIKPAEKSEDGADAANAVENTELVAQPERVVPKSWAELLRGKSLGQVTGSPNPVASTGGSTNGSTIPKSVTVADALKTYSVENEATISFLEPRGLVNTGNMCYMNSILQILVFCVPFYEFLDQVAKRAVHSFKSETPLIEAMIMFMREYHVLDSAASVEKLRTQIKSDQLEKYGEAFIPEYVYDVIKRLPRFSSMRRGHQQDAEEFLGFLLEGLHDECVHVMKKDDSSSFVDTVPMPADGDSTPASGDKGWLEVGPKQKAAVTRDSGVIPLESPITRIFGGKLRSEFRVPGLKNSVTLEPYQPLQLDIGSPQVYNITDALKGLTRSEIIQGDFNSPRGPGQVATKQVFIETLPPVLILHLKRFQYDNAGGTQKIWRKIGYPLELEIPKEIFPTHKRGAYAISGLPKYRLIGVVYHHGKNASGGHYTVDVRRQEGREWIRLDDTFIRRVRSEDVAAEGGEEDPKALMAALENHKRDEGSSVLRATGFEALEDENEDDQGGWSQVNGFGSPNSGSAKKWSGIVNGAGTATPSTAGKTTPKNNKFSVKDNKIAYILFYQKI